jgi:hypothetical protein
VAGCSRKWHPAGLSNLPGAEKGVLIQPFVQYPGSRFTTAGEAWRQVRSNWIIPYGGALLAIALLAIALCLLDEGTVRQAGARQRARNRALHALRARHALGGGDQLSPSWASRAS